MAVRTQGARSGEGEWQRNSRTREVRERVVKFLLAACAYLAIFTRVGIVVVLFEEIVRFFLDVSVWVFLISSQLLQSRGEFGVLR